MRVALACLALAACSKTHDYQGTYDFTTKAKPPLNFDRVQVGDEQYEIWTFDDNNPEQHAGFGFWLPPKVLLADHVGEIALVARTPCGDQRVPLALSVPDEAKLRHDEYGTLEGGEVDLSATEAFTDRIYIYVDDAGAPGAKVTLGTREVDYHDDASGIPFDGLPAPTCDDGKIIRVNGQAIGELPTKCPGLEGCEDDYLVSVTPGRCYVETEIAYGAGTNEVEAHLQGAQIYRLHDGVDFFLKEPDADVEVETYQNPYATYSYQDTGPTAAYRDQLALTDCATAPSSKPSGRRRRSGW